MRTNLLRVLLIILASSLSIPAALAADWKYFGGTAFENEKMITFYDSESLKVISDRAIRVWVKAIGQAEFKTAMEKNEKQIIKKTAEKMVKGYYPPFSLVNSKTTTEDCVEIISWEELANSYDLKPRAKFLFEINCIDDKMRILTGTSYKDDGAIESEMKTEEWDYISPESNGETLRKILCK